MSGAGTDRWPEELERHLRQQADELVELRLEEARAGIEKMSGSPIEALFATYLYRLAPFEENVRVLRGKVGEDVNYCYLDFCERREIWSPPADEDRPILVWYPQCVIKEYRVDFAIFGWMRGLQERDVLRYVVECDGYDWHERTKNQALKDRQRDRVLLQDFDFRVMRYLGSEIWREPERCVARLIESLAYDLRCIYRERGLEPSEWRD